MTRRCSDYRSLTSMKRDQRVCRACVDAGYPLESMPVIAPGDGQRAYMFGQAPGIVEGDERRPWRGRAGKTLRRWLELDEAVAIPLPHPSGASSWLNVPAHRERVAAAAALVRAELAQL